ncbi:hypothetical protein WH297_12965 [Ochrobactrum vermis]|uniref:Uncharacterized protein n=1 Tax=Ochrobactrum vermis TaxID=1827297 RepID=A0ABU8PGS2_9HYPH|nr:hypothetical protein [Ochrobactrum vermis]PQZ30939.1 hypothetical protein CQZ93_13170 [Ochrobactrum vermis]
MNRKERRASKLDWNRVTASHSYSEASQHLGEPALSILVEAFKTITEGLPMSDQELFDANMSLIKNGYLVVFIAFDKEGKLHVKYNLRLPSENAEGATLQ